MILPYSFQYSRKRNKSRNSGDIVDLKNNTTAKPSHTPSSWLMKLAWPLGSYQSTLAPPIGSSNNDIILYPNMVLLTTWPKANICIS